MFCSKCGKQIDDEAVVCINCGVPTKNMDSSNKKEQPIIINNSSSASSSASSAATAVAVRTRRHYSILLDLFLICFTGGLWIIWMAIRPRFY